MIELKNGDLHERTVTPEDFGVRRSAIERADAAVMRPRTRAARALLAGERGAQYAAKRDAVVVNAGAALCIAGVAASPREGADARRTRLILVLRAPRLAEWIAFGSAEPGLRRA